MEIKVIGDKRIFAIEYIAIAKYNFKRGHIKLWFDGFAIGNPTDDDFFFLLVNALNGVLNCDNIYPEFADKDPKYILYKLIDEPPLDIYTPTYDDTIVQLGEEFDDYTARFFKTSISNIRIIIAIRKNETNEFSNIISINLNTDYLRQVVNEYEEGLGSASLGGVTD